MQHLLLLPLRKWHVRTLEKAIETDDGVSLSASLLLAAELRLGHSWLAGTVLEPELVDRACAIAVAKVPRSRSRDAFFQSQACSRTYEAAAPYAGPAVGL